MDQINKGSVMLGLGAAVAAYTAAYIFGSISPTGSPYTDEITSPISPKKTLTKV